MWPKCLFTLSLMTKFYKVRIHAYVISAQPCKLCAVSAELKAVKLNVSVSKAQLISHRADSRFIFSSKTNMLDIFLQKLNLFLCHCSLISNPEKKL